HQRRRDRAPPRRRRAPERGGIRGTDRAGGARRRRSAAGGHRRGLVALQLLLDLGAILRVARGVELAARELERARAVAAAELAVGEQREQHRVDRAVLWNERREQAARLAGARRRVVLQQVAGEPLRGLDVAWIRGHRATQARLDRVARAELHR